MRPSRAATNRKTGYLSEMIPMYPTPTSVQRPNEGNMRMMRKQVLQGNISREDATAMVGKDIFKAHGKVRMYPTPTASCQMDVVAPPETVQQNSKGWSVHQSWNWNEVRSKAERCSEQDREDVQHSNNQRCEESNISKESNKQDIHSGKFDSTRTDKTWWEAQSELCGVPNGISYELDKDRSSRIKALGNSIVPQIARQLGLSIMEAELSG
jgi:hypothetical protein